MFAKYNSGREHDIFSKFSLDEVAYLQGKHTNMLTIFSYFPFEPFYEKLNDNVYSSKCRMSQFKIMMKLSELSRSFNGMHKSLKEY
jgi:hypothetical protein